MFCPTCSHTMEGIGESQGDVIRLCPRCGTVRIEDSADNPTVYVPKLVERCRSYEAEFDKENIAQFYRVTWHRLGIQESINLPENRPPHPQRPIPVNPFGLDDGDDDGWEENEGHEHHDHCGDS